VKLAKVCFVLSVLAVLLFGCSENAANVNQKVDNKEVVNSGEKPAQPSTEPTVDGNGQAFQVHKTKSAKGVEVEVVGVYVEDDIAGAKVKITNKTGRQINAYLDQNAKLVIGNRQLKVDMVQSDWQAEIVAGGTVEGVLVYPMGAGEKLDFSKAKKGKFSTGDIFVGDGSEVIGPIDIEFDLKK
jgi:hypothetical protein